jgi:hypothetical protein
MRTCLVLELGARVRYVACEPDGGEHYALVEKDLRAFNEEYPRRLDYDAGRCARLYVEYAQSLGASQDAMAALGALVAVKEAEVMAAVEKTKARRPGIGTATAARAQAAKKNGAAAPQAGVRPAPAQAAAAAGVRVPRERKKPTVQSRLRELVMKGTMTDDQIFAQVQREFKLPDKRRSYVSWTRGDLARRGMRPPPPRK